MVLPTMRGHNGDQDFKQVRLRPADLLLKQHGQEFSDFIHDKCSPARYLELWRIA